MKKNPTLFRGIILLACFISAGLGALTFTSWVGPSLNEATFKEFRTTVDLIKKEISLDKSKSLYFQKVWAPVLKRDSSNIIPELFTGEFLSSQKEIEYENPTVAICHYLMTDSDDTREDIMFLPEEKGGDSLFYYVEYNKGFESQNMKQTAYPIACITPMGQILPWGKEYILSQEYLTERVKSFLQDISMRYGEHKKLKK